jgi:serine/threonine-protein kinase
VRLDSPLVLAPGTRLIPAAALRAEDRDRAGCAPEEAVLTRGGARARSKVLTPEGQQVARLFETPTTIPAAARSLAAARGETAEAALRRIFPLLKLLINEGFLIEAAAAAAAEEPPLPAGTPIGRFRIRRTVQLYDDTALYEAIGEDGRAAALKIARNDRTTTRALLEREAALMARLPVPPAPPLLACGEEAGRPWLATAWLAGTPILQAVRMAEGEELAGLLVALPRAYAALHRAGVVHGDVHPGNVLVEPGGSIRLLDYGYARLLDPASGFARWKRGGVGFFFEPEYAAARLAGTEPPEASPAGEQYAVAALLFVLIAGRPHLDFPYDEPRMFAALRDAPPRSFAACGAAPWPQVEAVLQRALAKDPAARFPDMDAFADTLAAAFGTPRPMVRTAAPALALSLERVLRETGPSGAWFANGLPSAPRASVHSGAAGIAAGLLTIALVREDAGLLAAARHWSERALALSDRPDAYLCPAEDITRATVGPGGLAHGPAGAALVHGLVAGATGDPEGVREAMALFLAAAEEGGEDGDLFLGTAGHLLGATLLLEACSGIEGGPDPAPLEALGSRLAERFGRLLVEEPPIGAGGRITRLGMAHGWAGLLYALLGWARWKGQPPPAGTVDRLAQLRAAALPTAAGLRWPILAGGDASRSEAHMPGWCNGGAGHALLWVLAAEMLGEEYLAVAEAAAEEATAACSAAAVPFLCCGTVGVGFARLAVFLATGKERHLDAAALLAEQAAARIRSGGLPAHSLFRGAVGHAALVAALQRPEAAVLPVFGLPVGR